MQAVDIDTLLEDERVTYIKMDVEGAEMEALKGGKEQIKRNKPKLFIAAYHHDADIFLLPLFMWQLVPAGHKKSHRVKSVVLSIDNGMFFK